MDEYDPNEFTWPPAPLNQMWWELRGAERGMSPASIRFAAAKHQLGGLDSKEHAVAGQRAGIPGGRTEAFRQASKASVKWLLGEAAKVGSGKLAPLTDEQVDEKIDALIRNGDHQSVARGIELRNKRKAEKTAQRVEAPTKETVFAFLVGSDDLWGGEQYGLPPLLRVVGAWGLLGPMYAKEFGPYIVREFPDVARAMQPLVELQSVKPEPVIPLKELIGRIRGDAAAAQAAENAFHRQYNGDHLAPEQRLETREDGIAVFVQDNICPAVDEANNADD